MNVLHEGFVRTVFKGEYEPAGFALSLARKDIGLATELAKEFDVPMPVANLAEQMAIQAMNRGWADQDSTVIVRLQEEMAGVEIRADIDVSKAAKFITTHPDE
jgi:3-hydroxyisobutyrate dehydrogenase